MISIRTLETTAVEIVAAAFNRAFSDYAVPMNMTATKLAEMMRRRGVQLELSVGAFDDRELVGFTLNGFGHHAGELCGYDSGTGVVPPMRGHGLSTAMLDRTKELLRESGAAAYLLEVLQTNAPAISIYERAGFLTTRELLCYQLDRDVVTPSMPATLEEAQSVDWPEITTMWNSVPSWQNSVAAIERAGERRRLLVARADGLTVGYAVVFEQSADVAQLAVAHPYRRRGIGTALLAAARQCVSGTARALNIDGSDTETTAFFSKRATEFVRQYEMRCAL